MSVTSGSQDLKTPSSIRQKGEVEGTTTKVVDDNLRLPAFLILAHRLVDNTKNPQTGDVLHPW